MEKYTNPLIHETSPYLLQHAHNPVEWLPWGELAFEKAKVENKLILVSVGYSACHWCHVMENESFEDEEVAALMNKFFVCIKVDREERPDVDQVYMTAVQLMTQKGGWPLNCFTLTDGRPIYGGTYFPKEQWMQVLKSLEHTYRKNPGEVENYAQNMQEGIQQSEWIQVPEPIQAFSLDKIHELILRWAPNFDKRDGGNARAPKFPLPSNILFLLHAGMRLKDERILNHVYLTLDKMAMGGIYDQIGGGFARYSVDMLWKVPHFEKMLYDNGQLLSAYAQAYQTKPSTLYKRTIYQTADWLEREMMSDFGAFYSALDADSEGEEGKFYVWKKAELEAILGADFLWVSDFYSINGKGFWEEGNYILLRSESDASFARKMNWSLEELETKIQLVNQRLLSERSHLIRPGLDDKCLTAWNAISIRGLLDAYVTFQDDYFLHLALRSGRWLKTYQVQEDGSMFRNFKNGKSTITGFLEDYAHTIAAFIRLYETTFDHMWIDLAHTCLVYTLENFEDTTSKMFFFTPKDTELIARKMEINDNVIPASNSVMAENLFKMGKLFHREDWVKQVEQMLANVYEGMEQYGSGYSNWANVLLYFTKSFAEICITGENAEEKRKNLAQHYLPHALFAGGKTPHLPILENRISPSNTQLFVCYDSMCTAPTEQESEILEVLKGIF
jgi:uncharacterized protein YyaL (SSP411 family)